jgi:hypothetical protein
MRARQRRRQQIRRLTIIVTVVIIAVSFGVGYYLVSLANRPTSVDALIGQPVSASDMASLTRTSVQPYGPAASAGMIAQVQRYGGASFVSQGRPVVLYVGGEYCQFCAIQRWALVIALMRFGTFTNLHYMTTPQAEGDYATFTFHGSSYSSSYVTFRPYEAADRNGNALESVPANYSAVWQHFGSGFPFMDFGNTNVVASSTLQPTLLTGSNWTQTIASIASGTPAGLQVKESANLITALICKVTQGAPTSVCDANPINTLTGSIAGPVGAPLGLAVSAQRGPGLSPFPTRQKLS